MKVIPLTRGLYAKVDDTDFEPLSAFSWYAEVSRYHTYAKRGERLCGKNRTVSMHRHILGLNDSGFSTKVDHIDGDGLNNQRSNLRVCTHAQNVRNRRRHMDDGSYSSRYMGVTYHRETRKWHPRVRYQGRYMSLGLFADEREAAEMYDVAARLYYGEFARLNFPPAHALTNNPTS